MISSGLPAPIEQPGVMSGPVGPPSVGMGDSGDNGPDGRKAKRELSSSKRAAQNRAAQRAFRQRKEGYIKKLESQVRDFTSMEENFKSLQSENYELRGYVFHLQSRILELQAEMPPPPPNLNLSMHHPPAPPPEPVQASPLEVAAQAVAGLSRSEHMYAARADEDARTAEELTRQLADGGPDGLPSAPM